MHPDEFKKQAIRVDSASNITLDTLYLDSDYQPSKIDVQKPTEPNGLLVLFRVEPFAQKPLPTFLGRWDFNKDTVDIDVQKGSGIDEDAFKGERNGYVGHHPVTISNSPRVFGIDIRLPERTIFQARMSCTVDFGAQLAGSLNFKVEFSAELIPKK